MPRIPNTENKEIKLFAEFHRLDGVNLKKGMILSLEMTRMKGLVSGRVIRILLPFLLDERFSKF